MKVHYEAELFNVNGTVSVAEEQGKRERIKNITKKNAKKQICLNCKKKKCKGDCKDFREKTTLKRKK